MSENYEKLTEKQKRFIDFYIETANATESAKRAGYSEKTAKNIGNENLTKLNFFLQERLKEKEKDRISTATEVLQYFTTIMRNKEEDTNERTRCAENLAKRYGLFREEVKVVPDGSFEININVKKQ